jgi:hypothetical protein
MQMANCGRGVDRHRNRNRYRDLGWGGDGGNDVIPTDDGRRRSPAYSQRHIHRTKVFGASRRRVRFFDQKQRRTGRRYGSGANSIKSSPHRDISRTSQARWRRTQIVGGAVDKARGHGTVVGLVHRIDLVGHLANTSEDIVLQANASMPGFWFADSCSITLPIT